MAKFRVTPELAETIKSMRIQHNVTSKAVAKHIGKSQSYMSKLERGEIKFVDESILTAIFMYVFYGNDEAERHIDAVLEQIFDSLELRYSDKDIENQLWFDTFDTVKRVLPIPGEMIDDLVSRMAAMNVTAAQLCERINANEDIQPEVDNQDQYPFNEWQAWVVDHQIIFRFIKMKVDLQVIEAILKKEVTDSNYVTILSIIYYLKKIEKYGARIEISEEDSTELMCASIAYLDSYKFYSIAEFSRLQRKATSKAEQEALLSSFDKENITLMNEVIQAFQFISNMNITKGNEYISNFLKNLKWDLGFMMNEISLPFHEMTELSFTLKKQVLAEINETIRKYIAMPVEKKRIELYE